MSDVKNLENPDINSLKKRSISESWHSEEMKQIRELHKNGEYYKNEVLDVMQIPKDVNISEFIGPQGKSLKKLCIDIGINAQDIHLDTVNKFILIKHKGAKDYKSLIVNKLDSARFKPFDFQKTVFYKKLLMRHFCSKKFTNALDLKLGIKRNEDYYLWCWPSWLANSPSFVGRTQRCNGSR